MRSNDHRLSDKMTCSVMSLEAETASPLSSLSRQSFNHFKHRSSHLLIVKQRCRIIDDVLVRSKLRSGRIAEPTLNEFRLSRKLSINDLLDRSFFFNNQSITDSSLLTFISVWWCYIIRFRSLVQHWFDHSDISSFIRTYNRLSIHSFYLCWLVASTSRKTHSSNHLKIEFLNYHRITFVLFLIRHISVLSSHDIEPAFLHFSCS